MSVTYYITGPDGKEYSIDGPAGASQEQVVSAIKSQLAKQADLLRTGSTSMGDVGQYLKGGAGDLLSGIGFLTDWRGLENYGQEMSDAATAAYSPYVQAKLAQQQDAIDAAKASGGEMGAFGTALGTTLTDPTLALAHGARTLPSLLGGGGGGLAVRGATKLLFTNAAKNTLARAGAGGMVASNAALQGGDVGSDTYARAIAAGAPEDKARSAGMEAAGNAAMVSLATQMLPGGRVLERSVFGVTGKGATAGALKGFGKGVLGESYTEGLEEAGGRAAGNIALRDIAPTPWHSGVGQAGGMGTALGGIMGGPVGAYGGYRESERARLAEEQKKAEDDAKARAEANAQRAEWERSQPLTRQTGLPGMEETPEQADTRANNIARYVVDEAERRGVSTETVMLEQQRVSKSRLVELRRAMEQAAASGNLALVEEVRAKAENELQNLRGYGGLTPQEEAALERQYDDLKGKYDKARTHLGTEIDAGKSSAIKDQVLTMGEQLSAIRARLDANESSFVPKEQAAFDFDAPAPATPATPAAPTTPTAPEFKLEASPPNTAQAVVETARPNIVTKAMMHGWGVPDKAIRSPKVGGVILGLNLDNEADVATIRDALGAYADRTETPGLSTKLMQMPLLRPMQQTEIPIEPILAQQMLEKQQQDAADKARADALKEKFKTPGQRAEEERARAAKEAGRWTEDEQEKATQEENLFEAQRRQEFENQPVGYQAPLVQLGSMPATAPAAAQPTVDDLIVQYREAKDAKDDTAVAAVEDYARELYPKQWAQAKYNALSRPQRKLDFDAPTTTTTKETQDAVQESGTTEVSTREQPETGTGVGTEVSGEQETTGKSEAELEAEAQSEVDIEGTVRALNDISKREGNSPAGKKARRLRTGTDAAAAAKFVADDKATQVAQAETKAEREAAKANAKREQARAAQEQARAAQEQARAEQEQAIAEQERARAEQERARAEQAQARAEQEKAAPVVRRRDTRTAEDKKADEQTIADVRADEEYGLSFDEADDSPYARRDVAPDGTLKPRYKSVAEMLAALSAEFGSGSISGAMRAGRLHVYESENDISMTAADRAVIEALRDSGEGDTSGFYQPNGDYVVLIAQNTAVVDGIGAAVHEAGVHAGWKALLGEGEYNSVMRQIQAAVDSAGTSPFARAADAANKAAINRAADPAHVPEERLAYMAEQYPSLPLVRRIVSRVRNWMRTHGFNMDYTSSDVAVLARDIASKWMKTGGVSTAATPMARKTGAAAPVAAGKQEALDIVANVGRTVAPPSETHREKAERILGNVRSVTPGQAKRRAADFVNRFRTEYLSSNTAFIDAVRRELVSQGHDQSEITGIMLALSDSQALHSEAVAHEFLLRGGVEFDSEFGKYVATDADNNFVNLHNKVAEMSGKYGLDQEQTDAVLQLALEARRILALRKGQTTKSQEAEALRRNARGLLADKSGSVADVRKRARLADQYKKRAATLDAAATKVFLHLDEAQTAEAMKLFDRMPELNDIAAEWDGIRKTSIKFLRDTGVYSEEQAETYLDSVGFVPFYRDEKEMTNAGTPDRILQNLQVKKEKRLRGSEKPVHDIIDNMARWTQLAIDRGVRNAQAVRMVDIAKTKMPEGFVQRVGSPSNSTARIMRDGKFEFYEFEDPLFADAFTGLESFGVQWGSFAIGASSFLRQSVTLNPLFGVSQVFQDAYAALFTSGLSPKYALKVPYYAIKEFIKTYRGTSKLHAELQRTGVVGVVDYNAAIARSDAEVIAGFKTLTRGGTALAHLRKISMASDNALRQAVYELSLQQGLTKAEALEKAFELINFRRTGTSAKLRSAAQVIPFLNAYLQAMNVAYKTVSGEGISPVEKRAALKNLAHVTGMVMAFSMLYTMLASDDEDYQKRDAVTRDRLLIIPGTGGRSIPLRPDIFLLPKVMTEHAYLYLTNNATEDGAKMRKSISHALVTAASSPTPVPQVIKPWVEVAINHNFFTGRDLVGTHLKKLATAEQYSNSTSELGKAIGSTGLISPINADHIIRGTLGSVGGVMAWVSNLLISPAPGASRPDVSLNDLIATLPGMSPFMSKEFGTGLKTDFYDLRSEVDEVVTTYNTLAKRDPVRARDYVMDPDNLKLYALKTAMGQITGHLSDIRSAITSITEAPDSVYTAREKRDKVAALREIESNMLKAVNIKMLRELGGM